MKTNKRFEIKEERRFGCVIADIKANSQQDLDDGVEYYMGQYHTHGYQTVVMYTMEKQDNYVASLRRDVTCE